MADLLPETPVSTRTPSASTLDARVAVSHESKDLASKLQMIFALVLGLLLASIPLYLWRRPRSDDGAHTEAATLASAVQAQSSAAFAANAGPNGTATPGAGGNVQGASTSHPFVVPPGLAFGELRAVSCADKGKSASDCDALTNVDDSLKRAIVEHVACVPEGTTGTIEYVAEINFTKKKATVTVPKDGRTIKTTKTAVRCATQVKKALTDAYPFDTTPHTHGRYRYSVVATYSGK